jgi:hypothetical protein
MNEQLDLPKGMTLKHGSYYARDNKGGWIPLGKDLSLARLKFDALKSDAGTIGALFNRFYLEGMDDLAPDTQKLYRALIEGTQWEDGTQRRDGLRQIYGSMRATDLQASHAWDHYRNRGQTMHALLEIRLLRSVMTWARRWGVVKGNPWLNLQLKKPAKQKRPYVTDQMFEFALERATHPMVRHAMVIGLHSGLRKRDLLMLEQRHITERGILIELSKTGKGLLIEWSLELKAAVDACQKDGPRPRRFLLCRLRSDETGRAGEALSDSGFDSLWQRLRAQVRRDGGTPFNFHSIRKKSASDEADELVASRRLGHSDVRVTREHYLQLPTVVTSLRRGPKPSQED